MTSWDKREKSIASTWQRDITGCDANFSCVSAEDACIAAAKRRWNSITSTRKKNSGQ